MLQNKSLLNSIKGKIPCIYKCRITNEPTTKPGRNTKKRIVTHELDDNFKKDLLNENLTYILSGKVDGTCCRISSEGEFQKRRDVKKHKKIPDNWIETSNELGHRTGFMSIDKYDKYHKNALINIDNKTYIKTLIFNVNTKKLVISNVPISQICGQSVELLGPKVQGNKHNIPNNCVFVHGSIPLLGYPRDFNMTKLKRWFETDEKCKFFEGIVVHFSNGNSYKVHIHHFDIKRVYPSLMDFSL